MSLKSLRSPAVGIGAPPSKPKWRRRSKNWLVPCRSCWSTDRCLRRDRRDLPPPSPPAAAPPRHSAPLPAEHPCSSPGFLGELFLLAAAAAAATASSSAWRVVVKRPATAVHGVSTTSVKRYNGPLSNSADRALGRGAEPCP